MPPITRLSASRIKTFESCSFLYYAKYLEKVPDASNEGAAIGTVVHSLCEILFNKEKYLKLVNKIVKSGKSGKFSKGIKRLIIIKLKETGFYSESSLEKAYRFLLTALKTDFWIEGATVIKQPEKEFLLETEKYRLYGLIDKFGLFQDADGDWRVEIRDFKTSKSLFTEDELKNNIQAYSYLLAVKRSSPEINLLKSSVKFIMLQFPDNPIQEFRITNERQIPGFESFLEFRQKEIDNFKTESRLSNMAARQDYPKKEEGFKGKLLCGFAKEPGQLKKDGTKMFACPYKFAFKYYSLIDNSGKIVETSRNPIPEKPGFKLETKEYAGCAAFQKREYKQPDFENRPIEDIVDDFDF